MGGPALASLTESAYQEAVSEDSDSDTPSGGGSGEGKRLAGSSRNGSTSALAGVAAAHQLGDGGLQGAARRKASKKGVAAQTQDDDDDDDLPAYSDGLRSGETRLQTGTMSMDWDDEGYDESNYTHVQQPYHYGQSAEPSWSFGNLDSGDHDQGYGHYAYDENDTQTFEGPAQMSDAPSFFHDTDFSIYRTNRDNDNDSTKAMRSDDELDIDVGSEVLSMKINPLGADSDIDADEKVDDIFVYDDDNEDEVMLEGRGRGRSRDRDNVDVDSFRIIQEQPASQSVRKSIEIEGSEDEDEEDELPVVELRAPEEK